MDLRNIVFSVLFLWLFKFNVSVFAKKSKTLTLNPNSPTPQGQEAPTSLSRRRNARFSSVFFSKMLLFAKIYGIISLVKKMRCIYATDNYSKTSDFS